MKKLVSILIVILPVLLCSVTRTVSLDGTQQYTSIQDAINDCFFSGDIVLVYPGRYIENVNTAGHNITLASLYMNNPLQTYIDNTIIDGNLETCISIVGGEQVVVNGFTFVNNEQNSSNIVNRCGAIRADNTYTYLYISNSIIRDCTAVDAAGIGVGLGASIFLSNTTIYNNRALLTAGGLAFNNGSELVFDEAHPSSIYNNFASKGMDMFINIDEYYPTPTFNVYLSMGSLNITQPDNYFICGLNSNVNLSIQNAYLIQEDCDLYVNPNGDDNNTGHDETSPLKTIAFAVQKIKSNPTNPHAIYLSNGTYSVSENYQMFPFALKSDVSLIGTNHEQTIIDGEFSYPFICSVSSNNFEVKNLKLIYCRFVYSSPIEVINCNNIRFINLILEDNDADLRSGIKLISCSDIILNYIVINGVTSQNDISTLFLNNCDNVYINQLVSSNNTITDSESNYLGMIVYDSDVLIRNSIFANNNALDAWLFAYQTINPEFEDYNLDMSNVLFMDNTISNVDYVYCPIYMQNRYQPIKINNVTIANNTTNTTLTRIFAYADIKNLISYNPNCPGELYLRNNLTTAGVQAEVNISNSLFRSGSVNADLPNLVTFDECIFNGNPLFLGSVTDTLDASQPEYYYLSEGSPCINTGVADTTGMNLPLTDLAGNQRVWDGRIDMGCYEYGAPVSNDDPEYPIPFDKIMLSTYPNPVYLNGSKGSYTFIEFTLPKRAKEPPVVEIYNLKGQKVRSITVPQSYNDMVRKAGLSKDVNTGGEFYSTVYDCKDMNSRKLASGIYIVKVIADGKQASSKITILK